MHACGDRQYSIRPLTRRLLLASWWRAWPLSPKSAYACETQMLQFVRPTPRFCKPTVRIFFTLLSFSCLDWVDPFGIYEKSFTVPETSLQGSRWRFGDPNLHRFWLIYPCDGRTDGQTELRWLSQILRAIGECFVRLNHGLGRLSVCLCHTRELY